jgi:uncharacterized protein YkwD
VDKNPTDFTIRVQLLEIRCLRLCCCKSAGEGALSPESGWRSIGITPRYIGFAKIVPSGWSNGYLKYYTFFVLACFVTIACGGKAASGPDSGAEPVWTYPKPATGNETLAQGVERLNVYRALAQLGGVTVDDSISQACAGHLQYLAEEAASTGNAGCLLSHSEDNHANPYYSPGNEQAGMGALIACVSPSAGGLHLSRAVDRWIGSLYHRIPLLSPGLSLVGVAESSGYVCLNYQQGTAAPSEVQLVTWPSAGISDVPTDFPGRESPCPTTPSDPQATTADQCPASGFILTATWYGPAGSSVFSQVNAASITDEGAGVGLGVLAVYADGMSGADPVPGGIPRTLALVPGASLPAGTRVRVDSDAVLDGVERVAAWQFTTGSRKE